MAACLLAACATTATSAIALAQGQPTTVAQANFPAASSPTSGSRAFSASSRNGALLSARQAGRPLRPAAGRQFAEGAVRDRSVRRRETASRGQHAGRPGGREPDHQPDRLRGQQADRGRRPEREVQLRPRVVYTRTRVQNDVQRVCSSSTGAAAGSPRPSSPRSSSSTRTGSTWCSRSMRGPYRRPGDQFRRQREVQRQQAARRDRDAGESRWYRFLTTDDTYDPDRLTFDRE